MKDYRKDLAWLIVAAFLLPTMAMAQEEAPDQVQNGEAAYKIGCSLAATLGIPSCGELPSGRQFQNGQGSPDVSTDPSMAGLPIDQLDSVEIQSNPEAANDGEDAGLSSSSEQFQQAMQSLNNALQNWERGRVPRPTTTARPNQKNNAYNRGSDCPPGGERCY